MDLPAGALRDCTPPASRFRFMENTKEKTAFRQIREAVFLYALEGYRWRIRRLRRNMNRKRRK